MLRVTKSELDLLDQLAGVNLLEEIEETLMMHRLRLVHMLDRRLNMTNCLELSLLQVGPMRDCMTR